MTSRRTYKILLYHKIWGMEDKEYNYRITNEFELTTEHKYFNEADVVVFNMPAVSKDDAILNKPGKKEGQMWVFMSQECEVHYLWQYQPEILKLFDATATYKMDSDIPIPYFDMNSLELLRQKPEVKTGLISAFISSSFDKSNRLQFLKELMSYIPVDSYGKAWNNKTIINDVGESSKEKIISSYKFTLAFENAIAKDYVTEKFFQPLYKGSVPVYLGAPNVNEFAPGNNCYINVHDFSSIKDLADHLIELDNDPIRYEKYLQWKIFPFRNEFHQKLQRIQKHPLLSLIDIMKQREELSKNTFEKCQ